MKKETKYKLLDLDVAPPIKESIESLNRQILEIENRFGFSEKDLLNVLSRRDAEVIKRRETHEKERIESHRGIDRLRLQDCYPYLMKDYTEAIKMLKNRIENFKKYEMKFEIIENRIHVDSAEIRRVVNELAKIYAENEKQARFFELVEQAEKINAEIIELTGYGVAELFNRKKININSLTFLKSQIK